MKETTAENIKRNYHDIYEFFHNFIFDRTLIPQDGYKYAVDGDLPQLVQKAPKGVETNYNYLDLVQSKWTAYMENPAQMVYDFAQFDQMGLLEEIGVDYEADRVTILFDRDLDEPSGYKEWYEKVWILKNVANRTKVYITRSGFFDSAGCESEESDTTGIWYNKSEFEKYIKDEKAKER